MRGSSLVVPVCLSQCAHAGLAHLWKVCLSRPVAWASFVSGAGMCVRLAAHAIQCFGCMRSVCHALTCLPLSVEHLRDQVVCRREDVGPTCKPQS